MTDALLMGPPMASESPPTPPNESVRVASELMDMARVVCAHTKGRNGRRLKLTDYFDSILRPRLTKDHADVLKRIAREQKGD